MRLYLITADNSPIRLARKGRHLRTVIGPTEMFKQHVGDLDLDTVTRAEVVAPYNRRQKTLSIVLAALAIGMLSGLLATEMQTLALAATIPLALAIVSAIVPSPGNSTWVLVRAAFGAGSHMIVVRREDVGDFRRLLPPDTWNETPGEMDQQPLTDDETLRLRLMQVGVTMMMVAFSALALLRLQTIDLGFDLDSIPLWVKDLIVWSVIGGEICAFVLFVACWIRISLIIRSKRNEDSAGPATKVEPDPVRLRVVAGKGDSNV